MKHVQLTKPSFVFFKSDPRSMEKCCICDKRFEVKDASSVLGQKGVEKIKLIDSSIDAQVGDRVHIDCRRNLVRPPYVKVST